MSAKFPRGGGALPFLARSLIVFEQGVKMLTLSSMEKLIVECNQTRATFSRTKASTK